MYRIKTPEISLVFPLVVSSVHISMIPDSFFFFFFLPFARFPAMLVLSKAEWPHCSRWHLGMSLSLCVQWEKVQHFLLSLRKHFSKHLQEIFSHIHWSELGHMLIPKWINGRSVWGDIFILSSITLMSWDDINSSDATISTQRTTCRMDMEGAVSWARPPSVFASPTPIHNTLSNCTAFRVFILTLNVFTHPIWGQGKRSLAFI